MFRDAVDRNGRRIVFARIASGGPRPVNQSVNFAVEIAQVVGGVSLPRGKQVSRAAEAVLSRPERFLVAKNRMAEKKKEKENPYERQIYRLHAPECRDGLSGRSGDESNNNCYFYTRSTIH